MNKMTGSAIIAQAFIKEAVKTIFGYPGGAALNIYDELYAVKDFTHVLVAHEQAAVHAADGFARASGEVGVALVTSGPGFTNTVTALATAYMDSIPLVLISAQVPNSLIGTDAFQEIDAVGISRPCVKHNYLVKNIKDLSGVLKEAFYLARSGRPGPVHIDVPKDVTAELAEFSYPDEVKMKTYNPTYQGNQKQIKRLAQALCTAKQPLFYLGGGCLEASRTLRELIKLTQVPAINTLMALGTLDHEDALNLKMAGMHGSYASNMALSECDLLIAFGARFDDRVTGKTSEFAKAAKIAHIDIDPSSISKIIKADFPIVGSVKHVAAALLEEVRALKGKLPDFKPWHEVLANYAKLNPLDYETHKKDAALKPQWVIEEISRFEAKSDKDFIISTDVGQHQMWVAQFYPFKKPRRLITSGGLGTMGFGLPAAMGAAFACKDCVSINISGDGGILMNIQELVTLAKTKTKVISVILNNSYLGMVRQWQTRFYDNRLSQVDLSWQPDFVKLAQGFDALGFHVKSEQEFIKAFAQALESPKSSLINVEIDRAEDVLPMVPAGAPIYNMILRGRQ